jgi:hypothetical protein
MPNIECFWMEPTEFARSSLRRYERRDYGKDEPPSCPNNRMSHHDTRVILGNVPYPMGTHGLLGEDGLLPRDDPRWPRTCETCGYVFLQEDVWQHNLDRLFRKASDPDGKEGLWTTRSMPVGAMFDATWWPEKGPDGKCIAVILPPGRGDLDMWLVDGSSKDGKPWQRTGTPPRISATPSIKSPDYHGHLTNGALVPCPDSPIK